jgi:hypothetical protein
MSEAEVPITLEPDPVIEAFKKDIDRTMLREALKQSPEERLRRMHAALRGVVQLRGAAKATRP